MIKFMLKFTKGCFQEKKKDIFFVIIGMVLCVCVILSFTDSVLATDYTTEELSYRNNRVIFSFSDAEKITEVFDAVCEEEGIEGVFLRSTDNIFSHQLLILTGNTMPILNDRVLFTGHIPEKLVQGEAVISTVSFRQMGWQKLVASAGEEIKYGSNTFKCVASIGSSEFGLLVCMEDFLSMYEKYGDGNLEMYYIYPEGFSEKQRENIKQTVEGIKMPDAVRHQEKTGTFTYSDFVESIQDLILGMIIAVLNDMFLYGYVLNSRIFSYSVLKLQGISNGVLRLWMLFEMMVMYLGSFFIAGTGYAVYKLCTGNTFYNAGKIYLYTFVCLLVMNMVIFYLFIRKLIRQQPFEVYSSQRG